MIFLVFLSSAVFVEGDIETRVYNDAISGEVKNVPEICVRRDGMSIKFFFACIVVCWFVFNHLYFLYFHSDFDLYNI